MITIITCRGISEPYGKNMLWTATKDLDPKRFKVVELNYSAAYGPIGGEAFAFSQEAGRKELRNQIEAAPGKVILLGFSAGAKLAGDVALSIVDGRFPAWRDKVVAVGLVADPARHRNQIEGKNRGGFGITGERYIDPKYFPVWQFSEPGDPISELPVGNPLRTFADLSEFYVRTNPGPWLQDLLKKTQTNAWQKWWDVQNVTSWNGATWWLLNYLVRRRHISYNLENMEGSNVTYTARLGQLINTIKE